MKKQKTILSYLDTVLTRTQAHFFSQLSWTRKLGMYLAGGTALALQIGHRTSEDFDFYIQHHFAADELMSQFRFYLFPRIPFKDVRNFTDTLEINAPPDIHVTCFYYEYPLLRPSIEIEGVAVSSIQDIAAMKMIAITQRGRHRDFIDVYYLFQLFSLQEILRWTHEKYPTFDSYSGLRGLLYFDDAENDPDPNRVKLFDTSVTWKKVKKTITETVRNYQLKKVV